MVASSQAARAGVQSRNRRTKQFEELDEEDLILDGIIPTASAEPAPDFTDDELPNTNPPLG